MDLLLDENKSRASSEVVVILRNLFGEQRRLQEFISKLMVSQAFLTTNEHTRGKELVITCRGGHR